MESSNQELTATVDDLNQQLTREKEELRIAKSESEDYRLMEAQAARRLVRLLRVLQ